MAIDQPIDFSADPRVQTALDRFKDLVPDADLSEIVRAAVLNFAEATPDHEIAVYIREQMALRED